MIIKNVQIFPQNTQIKNSAQNFDIYIGDTDGVIERIIESNIELGQVPDSFEEVIDVEGAAVIPSLYDHHIHLLSLKEAGNSLDFSDVRTEAEFKQIIASAKNTASSLRGIGYHESIFGALTKETLDELVPDIPFRVQHQTGALWVLNSKALTEINASQANIQLDDGCLLRGDELLRRDSLLLENNLLENNIVQSPSVNDKNARNNNLYNDLRQIFKELNQYGVMGATDATPGYGKSEVELFSNALIGNKQDFAFELMMMLDSTEDIIDTADVNDCTKAENLLMQAQSFEKVGMADYLGQIKIGPKKILLDDFALPSFDDLSELVSETHKQNRSVAVHSVTEASLAFLVAVFHSVGSRDGDRVEHASMASPDLLSALAKLGVRVVTQPNFIFERGDTYLAEIPSAEIKNLYRCKGWLEAGVNLAGGTDAPFGSANPWVSIWAAMNRKTQDGKTISPDEQLDFEQALNLFLSEADDPGGKPRQIKVGQPASLCVLNAPISKVIEQQLDNPVEKFIYKSFGTSFI